jgi:hypothetical protein
MTQTNSPHAPPHPHSSFPRAKKVIAPAKKRLEELADTHTELARILAEQRAYWRHRLQSEAKVAAEFFMQLAAAKSMSDVFTAGQNWTSHRLRMTMEDTERLAVELQKGVERGMRLFLKGAERKTRNGGS